MEFFKGKEIKILYVKFKHKETDRNRQEQTGTDRIRKKQTGTAGIDRIMYRTRAIITRGLYIF